MTRKIESMLMCSVFVVCFVFAASGASSADAGVQLSGHAVYAPAAGAHPAEPVSAGPQPRTPGESAFIWIFTLGLVLAATCLIIWALAVSSGSLLPAPPQEMRPISRELEHLSVGAGGQEKAPRHGSPKVPAFEHPLPHGV